MWPRDSSSETRPEKVLECEGLRHWLGRTAELGAPGMAQGFVGGRKGCMEVSIVGRSGLFKLPPSFSKLHPEGDLGFQQILKGGQSQKKLAFVES